MLAILQWGRLGATACYILNMAIYMSHESWLPKQPIKCGKLDYFCMVYMRVARQQETHLIYYFNAYCFEMENIYL